MKLRPTYRTRITTQPVDSGAVFHVGVRPLIAEDNQRLTCCMAESG